MHAAWILFQTSRHFIVRNTIGTHRNSPDDPRRTFRYVNSARLLARIRSSIVRLERDVAIAWDTHDGSIRKFPGSVSPDGTVSGGIVEFFAIACDRLTGCRQTLGGSARADRSTRNDSQL